MKALFALTLMLLALASQVQAQNHFFPSRPTGATLHTETGILTTYGIGNDTGGFTVKRGAISREFAVGFPLRLAGTLYRCLPIPSRKHDDGNCKRWPAALVVGKSRVRVTYWWQEQPGVGRVRVSDTITLDP
jgi:hypothetical protein